MNATLKIGLCALCLSAGILLSAPGYGQYYPGGGYGRGGMGGYGRQSLPSTPMPPALPNMAGQLADRETKWLKENLSLTKDQAKAVKKLNNEYASQQQDALKDILGTGGGRPSPEAQKQVKEMMLMLNEEKEDKLKPLLTPEQWTLYQSKKPEMQQAVGGFRPPAPAQTPAQSQSATN